MSLIARLLGVKSNQVYMWHQRRAKNGFPEHRASVIVPQYPGDKRKSKLFDLNEVTDWWATYDPRARSGAHWAEKRARKAVG